MEMVLCLAVVVVAVSFYGLGQLIGIKKTFDKLEKEGKIISKDDLEKLKKLKG